MAHTEQGQIQTKSEFGYWFYGFSPQKKFPAKVHDPFVSLFLLKLFILHRKGKIKW